LTEHQQVAKLPVFLLGIKNSLALPSGSASRRTCQSACKACPPHLAKLFHRDDWQIGFSEALAASRWIHWERSMQHKPMRPSRYWYSVLLTA